MVIQLPFKEHLLTGGVLADVSSGHAVDLDVAFLYQWVIVVADKLIVAIGNPLGQGEHTSRRVVSSVVP